MSAQRNHNLAALTLFCTSGLDIVFSHVMVPQPYIFLHLM
jgi:hypothetical protein